MTYRAYENPYKLEQMLEEIKKEIKSAIERGADEDDLIDLECEKYDLQERIRFAWADDEADMNGWD